MDDIHIPEPAGELSWTQMCAQATGVSEVNVIEVVGWYEQFHGNSNGGSHAGVAIAKLFRWMLGKKEKHRALKAAAYALRMDEEINFKTMADIAREEGCERENIRKMVNDVQTFLDLPPREDQRKTESKKRMSQKRRGQLVPNGHDRLATLCFSSAE